MIYTTGFSKVLKLTEEANLKLTISRRGLITGIILGTTALIAPKFWIKPKNRYEAFGMDKERPNFDDSQLEYFTKSEYLLVYDFSERIIPSEGVSAPGASDIGLANKIDSFVARNLEADVKNQLKIFLDAFEAGSELLRGRSFSELTPEDQAEYIRFWRYFPSLTLLRGGFLALKRVVTAVYFSTKEAWDYIDYGGPLNVYRDPFRERDA
jgi:hypothetical protein